VKGSAVPKPQWSDFGTIWKTVREVDVNAIRHEAERGIAIVCIGQRDALWRVDGFLRDGPNRYPLDPTRWPWCRLRRRTTASTSCTRPTC
jgi:hypothetical protein